MSEKKKGRKIKASFIMRQTHDIYYIIVLKVETFFKSFHWSIENSFQIYTLNR